MRILVTGANGLIGSELVSFFSSRSHLVYGIDNNMRRTFFGPNGDTRWSQEQHLAQFSSYRHLEVDIRNRELVLRTVEELKPDAILHTAAQPSHDLAAQMPFEDFDVNAVGTFNLLESVRRFCPEAVFVHMSTNKVYGDAPNEFQFMELPLRWEFPTPGFPGISESCRIDQSKHSLFGASKLAADVMVQEYGRYFGMRTVCLRGGCLTGPQHSGVELHGFLSYLVKCNLEGRKYRIFGYKGKQVRDNIHSLDVARFIDCFLKTPRSAAVYNIGGGKENSCSILEAFELVTKITGNPMSYDYVDTNRIGDHICYYSDLQKIRADYPNWEVTLPLEEIVSQICSAWEKRLSRG